MNKEILEEVLTLYESKSNEELLQEVQDIYYSYPVSGGIRKRNFYNKINMNGKTVRTIVGGRNKRIGMEAYIKFLLVGPCPEWLLPKSIIIMEQEKLSKKQRNKEIAEKNKKLYQHEYYLHVTKEKRRLQRKFAK